MDEEFYGGVDRATWMRHFYRAKVRAEQDGGLDELRLVRLRCEDCVKLNHGAMPGLPVYQAMRKELLCAPCAFARAARQAIDKERGGE